MEREGELKKKGRRRKRIRRRRRGRVLKAQVEEERGGRGVECMEEVGFSH